VLFSVLWLAVNSQLRNFLASFTLSPLEELKMDDSGSSSQVTICIISTLGESEQEDPSSTLLAASQVNRTLF
jgi:hypothetical protein